MSDDDRFVREDAISDEISAASLPESPGAPGAERAASEALDASPEEARALRALVEELRATPTPALDWDPIERRLLARIARMGHVGDLERARRERDGTPAPTPLVGDVALVDQDALANQDALADQDALANPRRPKASSDDALARRRIASGLFVAVAAAAVLALTFTGAFDGASKEPTPRTQERHSDLAAIPRVEGAYRVDAILPASAFESGDEALQFALPGVATWTLAPHSRVVVDTVARPHRITLERGRVDAQVVPRKMRTDEESFAVIAGTTRVAVRGTVFSVSRDHRAVTVAVTRGSVAVSRLDGDGEGGPEELLVGPAQAAFSLDGERIARPEGPAASATPTSSTAASEAEARVGPAPRREADPPGSASGEPASPATPAPKRLSVAEARGVVLGCLQQALDHPDDGGEGREVTVSSAVTVTLGPEGRVDAVRFSPPLRPDLQQRCGGALFGRQLDAEGRASFRVAVTQ